MLRAFEYFSSQEKTTGGAISGSGKILGNGLSRVLNMLAKGTFPRSNVSEPIFFDSFQSTEWNQQERVDEPKRLPIWIHYLYGSAVMCTIAYKTYCLSRVILTKVLANSERPIVVETSLRSQFMNAPKMSVIKAFNHTHSSSAGWRTSATNFISNFSSLVGLRPYFIQMSSSDQRAKRAGMRTWFWSKDVHIMPCMDPREKRDINVLVDVDQYLDMNWLLVDEFRPFAIYTFQPDSVAKTSLDYSYTCEKDNSFTYRVTGGGKYNHKVWNYSHDSLVARKTFLGFTYSAAVYAIDRRPYGEDHEVILLTPVRRWGVLTAWLTWWINGPTLSRLNPVHGDYTRLKVFTPVEGPIVSTGRPGEFNCARVPAAVDEALASMQRTSKVGLTLPSVQSRVVEKNASAILHEYHVKATAGPAPEVYPNALSVRRYQFEPTDFDPDCKPSLVPFMSPIVHECFAPDLNAANEKRSIKGRIEEVKSDVELNPKLTKYCEEFIKLVFPDKGILHPTDDDELYERQNRPTQRAILNRAGYEDDTGEIKAFQKKEAYDGPSDPRNISTYGPTVKAAYSKYMYPLAKYMETKKWYAFGKTPREISERVSEVCTLAKLGVSPTDFSRYDGRLSYAVRNYERMMLLWAYHEQYHAELIELNKSQFNLTGFGKFGVKYFTGPSRGSGSPETAVMNTGTNALLAYCGLRESYPDKSPQECYDMLGLFGGDDGLSADMNVGKYISICEQFGQKLEATLLPCGSEGVNFLSRIYTANVWHGGLDSVCDIRRQLSKLHATPNMTKDVTPLMKITEKLRGFMHSDRNTPVIGHLVKRAEMLGLKLEANDKTVSVKSWYADIAATAHYPNDVEPDWAQDLLQKQLPTFNLATFYNWLDTVNTPEKLLSPVLCAEPLPPGKPKAPVVVDDIIIDPSTPSYVQSELNCAPQSPSHDGGKACGADNCLNKKGKDEKKIGKAREKRREKRALVNPK